MATKEVDYTPEDGDNYGEIPPQLADGAYTALCKTKEATTKEGFPRVFLEWQVEEAHDSENETFVGERVSDMIDFLPTGKNISNQRVRWSREHLKNVCNHLKVAIPQNKADIPAFVEALNGSRAVIYCRSETRKDTGLPQIRVAYSPPRGMAAVEVGEKASKPAAKKATKKKAKAE